MYTQQLLYPFICRQTSSLLPCPSYCKQCCNEHRGACVFFSVGFLRIYAQQQDRGQYKGEEEECFQSNWLASVLDAGQLKAPFVRIGSTVREEIRQENKQFSFGYIAYKACVEEAVCYAGGCLREVWVMKQIWETSSPKRS